MDGAETQGLCDFDAEEFLRQFVDHCLPKLDVYEQAIYLYAVRHSRAIGQRQVIIGLKSARKKLAFGIGKASTPPSEAVCYQKARSLHEKGLLAIIASERSGMRMDVFLPQEAGFVPIELDRCGPETDIEVLDFFSNPDLRNAILVREERVCFYCRSSLDEENYVIEHVVSRPEGDNSYRNLVAACRRCNNRKSGIEASSYLRILFREGFLSAEEFEERMGALELLRLGKLRPNI